MTPPTGKRSAAARTGIPRKSRRAAEPTAPAKPVRAPGPGAADPDEVHERIWSAIMDHSLPPETRLVEERLCEIFGLGRTRLRQVLQRLAHENVVTLMPNRGAMVARPSIREARDVFAARRVLETGTVNGFLDCATREDLKRMHNHLAREKAAWKDNDRRAALKLSGEFHLVVAEGAGNRILVDMLRDLVSRSSLIIAVYQAPNTPTCPPDEHERLVAALEKGDRRAVDLMVRHLDHVLADLRLQDPEAKSVDLESVLAPGRRDP
jgi:DNA-binding GntR family transcriptional regulator